MLVKWSPGVLILINYLSWNGRCITFSKLLTRPPLVQMMALYLFCNIDQVLCHHVVSLGHSELILQKKCNIRLIDDLVTDGVKGNFHKILMHLLTLLVLKWEYSEITRRISWLMMPWLLESSGHQQLWYWLGRISRSLSSTKNDFSDLHLHSVEKWYEMQIYFICFLKWIQLD